MANITNPSEEDSPFHLDEDLLSEYPEMKPLSGMANSKAPTETWVISQVYSNGKAIDDFIRDSKARRATGNIHYHIQLVEEGLQKIPNDAKYKNFVQKESKKMADRKSAFTSLRTK